MTKKISLTYNDKVYDLTITKRRMRAMRIKISQNGEISVNIPNACPYSKAIEFVESKFDWIEKSVMKSKSRTIDHALKFVDGEKVLIFGETKTIQIATGQVSRISIHDDNLIFKTKYSDYENRARYFLKWAKKYFYDNTLSRFEEIYSRLFLPLKIKKPTLKIKAMKSMWGNCKYKRGELTLNVYLLKTPLALVDYIILHELTHLIYHDHGREFKAFLTSHMPDWKIRERELKKYYVGF